MIWEAPCFTEADRLEVRWWAALHEAGHVAGAVILLHDKTADAVVLPDGRGMTYFKRSRPIMPLLTFDEILQVAAGTAAEALAAKHPKPVEAPAIPAQSAVNAPERAARQAAAAKDMEKTLSDAVRVARWCCEGRLDEPEKWAWRRILITHYARSFAADHAGLVLKVARKLYCTGYVGPAELKEIFEGQEQ